MYQAYDLRRDKNPRENANLLSIISFFFTYKIFKKGLRKELEEDDVYEILKDYQSTELGDKIEKEWRKEEKSGSPSLVRTLFRVFGRSYLTCGAVQCVLRTSFMVARPLATGRLIAYFSGRTNMTKSDAYFYAGMVIGVTVLQTIYNHNYMLYMQQMAQKIRIGLCSAMYRKSLRLSTSSLVTVSNGKIVTLMAKDVNLFDSAIVFAQDMWIGIVQVIIMTYVMYEYIGVSAIFGVGFLALLTPFQMWIGKQTTKNRLKTATKSDERIRLIQEVLATVQIIKLYSWENYFNKLVNFLRKIEIGKLKIIFYLKATMLSLADLSTRISFYICMMTYISFQNHITAEKAFVVLGCYGSLRSVLTISIPLGISQVADLLSSIKRIRAFLLTKEVKKTPQDITRDGDTPRIELKNVSAEISDKVVLRDVNMELRKGLYGLTGEIGSGKSSLFKLLLEDITATEGHVRVNGSVSYASQEPWLFPGTIRQNILFGSPVDPVRYGKVVKICGLIKDFNSFSKRDKTLVNDKGLNLSKGQQCRITLARAVYREADIYLLDNPLAALDFKVSNEVFQNCMRAFLGGKLCVLVTHRKRFLKEVDTVLVMKNGTVHDKGSYSELSEGGVTFSDEVEEEVTPDKKVEDEDGYSDESDNDEASYLLKSTLSIDGSKGPRLYAELKKQGKVDFGVYRTYFRYAGGFLSVGFLFILAIIGQFSASFFDYFVTYWIKIEGKMANLINNNATTENADVENTTDGQNYTIADDDYQRLRNIQSHIPYIYSILLAVTTAAVLGKSFYFFVMTSRCSMKLHRASFLSIVKAPMEFFDYNLSGNIVNRFSKDFCAVDEYIPYITFECLRIVFIILGILILITLTNYYFLILSLGFGVVLFTCRHYYLPTSRSLKRLENTTRSPVVGYLNSSLEGLTTIRASEAEATLKMQFDKHQDLHSSTAYMCLTTNRAFGFVLDMLCALYTTIITLSFVVFASSTSAEYVGLAITQGFGLTGLLQWGIRQWAELENQMTSVERIVEYTEIPSEVSQGFEPKNWPSDGQIEFDGVHLRYPKTKELVLKDISFTINSKEKVGIIGRTGAGKSSVIATLFRLYEIESGTITVDGLDIKMVALQDVRSNISLIPQNPVLFSGTLRSNLDPDFRHSDADLWRALEVVCMKTIVIGKEFQLDCVVNEGGCNFSSGQRQLVCLARAVLRKNKILVLDEATANIDPETDAVIQKTIKKQFKDSTVITIAHRLNSVINSDKIMVLEDGAIVEFDTVKALLKDKKSAYYNLLSQAGLLAHEY